ncbi:MAG: hypothetical protein ABEJ44_06010 [Halanaeroarchaeum sp.]
MHVRTRAVAVLALIVVSAGCLAAPGATGASGADLNASIVATEHERALEAAGSYTYRVAASATVDGRSAGSSSITAAVDVVADRARVQSQSALGPVTTYLENGSVYQRVGTDPPQYQTLEGNVSAGEVVSSHVAAFVANYSFEPNGTTTIDGEVVRVYVAHATGSNATIRQDFGENVDVTEVEATLAVNEDGVVVRHHIVANLSIQGGKSVGTYTRTVTFTNVGSTDVDRPPWLDEARAATGKGQ